MAGDTEPDHDADLDLVLALARGLSVTKAAKQCRMSRTTVWRRMQDPVFTERLCQTREEIWGRTVGILADANCKAVTKLAQLLEDPSSLIGLNAARTILQEGIKIRDAVEVAEVLLEVKEWMRAQRRT
jgi:hypothetical protein